MGSMLFSDHLFWHIIHICLNQPGKFLTFSWFKKSIQGHERSCTIFFCKCLSKMAGWKPLQPTWLLFFPVASITPSGITATVITLIHEMWSETWYKPISAQPFAQLTVLTKCPGETQLGLPAVTPAGALHFRVVASTEHTGGEDLGCRPLPRACVHKGQIYKQEDAGNRARVRWRAPATHNLCSPLLGQRCPRRRQRERMNLPYITSQPR